MIQKAGCTTYEASRGVDAQVRPPALPSNIQQIRFPQNREIFINSPVANFGPFSGFIYRELGVAVSDLWSQYLREWYIDIMSGMRLVDLL